MSAGERQQVTYDFYDIKELPLILGAVDGTLIPIKAPSVDEHLYVCRKGYHALNIQCVCNAKNKFLDVVYFLSLAVDVDQRGVKSQGLSPYALSPSNQSLCISPDSNARDKLQ
jgi:hypothetical protein